MTTRAQLEMWLAAPQVRAFLDTLAYCEGANYDTLFGGGRFSDYSRHPEKMITAGGYTSDAAGRYQFLSATYPYTWRDLVRRYGFSDFSPHTQDLGGVALINDAHGIDNLLANDFSGAVTACRGIWPSLPGGRQHTRTWAEAGGWYAGSLAALGGSGAGNTTSGTTQHPVTTSPPTQTIVYTASGPVVLGYDATPPVLGVTASGSNTTLLLVALAAALALS